MMSNSEARKRQSERAAGELVADVDTLAAAIRRVDGNHDLGAGALAEALVAAGFGSVAAARREALLSAADLADSLRALNTDLETGAAWMAGAADMRETVALRLRQRAHQIGTAS